MRGEPTRVVRPQHLQCQQRTGQQLPGTCWHQVEGGLRLEHDEADVERERGECQQAQDESDLAASPLGDGDQHQRIENIELLFDRERPGVQEVDILGLQPEIVDVAPVEDVGHIELGRDRLLRELGKVWRQQPHPTG